VLFVIVFTLAGFLRSGYEPLKTFVSALSLGPNGWIQQVNFVLLGLLLLFFAYALTREFPTGQASKAGPILVAVMALLFIVSGPFVMDPTGTPSLQMTVHGTIHGLAGGIIFLLMPITCFVYLRRFRADPYWQSFQGWTLSLGIIITAAVLLLTLASKQSSIGDLFVNWMGLIQRFIIVPFMLWVFLFAFLMYQRTRKTE
jgi:hypothetical protein